jgi:hypothetical protein
MILTHARLCFALLLAFLLATPLLPRLVLGQDSASTARPPVAPTRPVVDDYFGAKVTDLYR